MSFFDGNVVKVPLGTPHPNENYIIFGEIISHGFILTDYFTIFISMVCASYLFSGSADAPSESRSEYLFNFLDTNEARALKLCHLANSLLEYEKEEIIVLFSWLRSTTTPTSANLKQLTKTVAKFTLFIQPFFVFERVHCVVCWRVMEAYGRHGTLSLLVICFKQ